MNAILFNTTLLIGLVPGPVLKGNAQAFTVHCHVTVRPPFCTSQWPNPVLHDPLWREFLWPTKVLWRKSHFPRECDMKSLPNALGDRIRVNIVLKYLKLCKDERTRNNCSIAKYIRGCSYLPKVFGRCVFHISLPRYFSLLLLKSLQEISVWRKSSPKSSNGSIAIACRQTF